MSTRFDILDAKEDYDNHNSRHRCGELTKCSERSALWRTWMDTAGRHGYDEYPESHDDRQRRQYNERVRTGSATG
jgi:hypothetical protein